MNNNYENIKNYLSGTSLNFEEGTGDNETKILCIDLNDTNTIIVENLDKIFEVSLLTEDSRDGEEISYHQDETHTFNCEDDVIKYLKDI